MKISIGDKCPTFELNDQEGKLRKSEEFLTKKALVLYFYPKDDTPFKVISRGPISFVTNS